MVIILTTMDFCIALEKKIQATAEEKLQSALDVAKDEDPANLVAVNKDFAGYTPLMYSLKHRWYISDELDMARALIDAGASVNVKSDNGETVDDILSMNNIKRSKLFNKESSNFFMNLFQ